MNDTISLVLIEDNRLLREGLARLIREQEGFRILAASADADEAMTRVREAKPDVVLLDFGLEGHDSLAITATVHREVPHAKVIVLGLLPLEEDVVSFVRAGASGFIMKEATFDDFVRTIRSVAAGGVILPPQLAASLFSQIANQVVRRGVPRELEVIELTQREGQVIDLITEGLANKDIAARLHIAIHTVKSHVHNILEKLALRSRLEVAALNREAERLSGWTEKELLGEPLSRLIPERFQRLLDPGPEASGGSLTVRATDGTVSCFARRQDGSEFPVELTRRALGAGGDAQSLVTLRDLTQWRRTQETRARNNEQARATLESIGDAVITTDHAGRITYLNPVAESMTGWDAEDALGQSLDAVLPLISEATRQPVANTTARCLEEGRAVDLEDGVILLRRDGTEIPIGDSAAPILDRDGGIAGVVLVIQNESEKRRVGHRLSFEATHDALTGLINRREFERRLTRVINGLSLAAADHMLLCLDLDRFKMVNDSCGHDAGDDLLGRLSALLGHHMRKRDTLARLGGDEFGVLLENCPLGEAERIAESLRVEVEQFRFEWGGQTFSIGASIGLIPVTEEKGGIAAVLRAADAACYAAKDGGGNRVQVERSRRDSAGMSQAMARRVTRLARAVDEGHFQLYAQRIVPLQPEPPSRARFEILLRLPDGRGGMQSAADFLPQAERYSLMPAIDRWVVRETIALLGQWQREHPDSELPVCSINLSASALADDSLLKVVEQELAKNGIPSEILCFEIAETAALGNLARTVRFLSGIRAAGCEVALDDVGSGVTSFTYLKTLPVEFLKIGGPFVRGVAEDPMYGSIVSAVDQIGRSMGISTVAKQVGSEPILNKLRALGIGYAQGHALTAPMPLTDSDGRMMRRSLQRSA